MSIWPSVIASVLTLSLGGFAFYVGTDGGQAWTAESARRLKIKSSPIALPPLSLVDHHGNKQLFFPNGKTGAKPSLIFMEFIYTTCPTICLAMGAEFSRLQNLITSKGQHGKISLLSISFDPKDQSPQLASYLGRFAAEPNIWMAAKFSSDRQLNEVMNLLGVIAIPEENFGFVHNAAVYVVDNGSVVAILDHDDHKGIQQEINRYLTLGKSVKPRETTALAHENI